MGSIVSTGDCRLAPRRFGRSAAMGVAFVPSRVAFASSSITVEGAFSLSPEELERLSAEYALTRDPRLRESLILHHQRLVRSLAARFLGLGETLEDLVQVGNIGLINALDRFDPRQGNRFSTYATPTVLGEIRRYFRDKAPAIRPPRWMADLQRASRKAAQQLGQELGRQPTTCELAIRLGESEERVLQAIESGEAISLLSLDTPADGGCGGGGIGALGEQVGCRDRTMCAFERFGDLWAAMTRLSEREREVIVLRFFDELSQACVARQLNVSQMHVSRLQHRALSRLRDLLADEPPGGSSAVALRN